jgi:type I restriction enzyme S subunit
MSGAVEARMFIRKGNFEPLKTLTSGYSGGIFKAPRLSPVYVEDSSSGHPYLSSTDIQCNDLSRTPLISKKQAAGLGDYYVKRGMTLVTSSGETGRPVFARTDMDGMMGSPHFMRINPDSSKVDPGFLFAFLSCEYGNNLMTAGTYGSIIVAIEPAHVENIPVPRFSQEFEREVAELINEAEKLRVEANATIISTREVFNKIGQDIINDDAAVTPKINAVTSNTILGRFDAAFHDPVAEKVAKKIMESEYCSISQFCSELSLPGIFKRIYSEDESIGAPYVLGSAVYWMEPKAKGILSPKTSLYSQVLVQKGTVLVQAFGQKGGLIGRPTWVGEALDGCATTHMLVRLIPRNCKMAGYLFAFLDSDIGYSQIIRLPFGGSIPHFTESDIGTVLIPLMPENEMLAISSRVLEAFSKRDKALSLEKEARALIEKAIFERSNNG